MAYVAPIIAHSGSNELTHVDPIVYPGKIWTDELSFIAQALKTCADELSPMYTSISSEETYANEQPPIAQAMKTCAHELSPIAQAGKTCADGLPHTKYTIAQAGGNMCSSRSSYSSFWAR